MVEVVARSPQNKRNFAVYTNPKGVDSFVEGSDETQTIVKCVREHKREAEDAKRDRLLQNEINRDAYLGRQDFSGKIDGQSAEFLPKTSLAVERLSAFIKKGLIQSGDWYQINLSDAVREALPFAESSAKALLDHYINHLPDGQFKTINFATRLTDNVKLGALESLVIFKVHGYQCKERRYRVKEQPEHELDGVFYPADPEVEAEEISRWRLGIDILPLEDYYCDPTGRGLYEIHSAETDLHVLVDKTEEGYYDKEVVDQLLTDFKKAEDERRRDQDRGQAEATPPGFRKRVVIDEYWGHILDADGRVVQRNIRCAIANDKYVIRKPEPNPLWHGESPFVAVPLIRVPLSTLHKAIFDEAASLNLSLNELVNLIIDAGKEAVWGVRQVRPDVLINPEEIQDGVAPGTTLVVNQQLPYGQKALERITEPTAPPEAFNLYQMLNAEFASAALSNELNIGQFPGREVKATEVVEMQQSQSATLDTIIGDIENELIEPVLRKAFLTILQFADNLLEEDLVDAVGEQAAAFLHLTSPAKRFVYFASKSSITVSGLSETLSKVRDFQKFMAALQAVQMNPLLAQAFMKRYSPDKHLRHLYKQLNLDPSKFERSPEESSPEAIADEMKGTVMMRDALGGGSKGSGQSPMMSGPGTGGGETPAEINQISNPLTGLNVGGQ
jgi:hypothetical protein